MVARIRSFVSNLAASARGQALLRVCAFAVAVGIERRSIAHGSRGRLKRVDARTGAAPSLRQTIVVLGAREALRWFFDRAIPRPGGAQRRAAQERQRELHRELPRVRAQHAGDPQAQQEAIVEVYRERYAGPVNSSWLPLSMLVRTAARIAVNRCPVPFLDERRTLADLLAGTKLAGGGPSWRVRLRRK
jgi:hypothetical protein